MLFNFTGLHAVFKEAILRREPSVAFQVSNGQGKFTFLLFIVTNKNGDIQWGNLELFIILARTQGFLALPLRGNHYKAGDFKVTLSGADEQAIRAELGIEDAIQGKFSFGDFLSDLNSSIPQELAFEEKIACIQAHKVIVREKCGSHIDGATKVYLLGRLPLSLPKRPREETLRKLYMLNADPKAIARLIHHLKRLNWTTRWTATKPSDDRFAALWAEASSAT